MRADAREFGQFGQQLDLLHQAVGRAVLHEVEPLLDAVAQLVEVLDAQRPRHALLAAEEVDDHGDVVAAHVLEEQRRAARLADTVGDLGDLQLAGDGRADALKLSALLQQRDELAQIRKRHRSITHYSLDDGRGDRASREKSCPNRLYGFKSRCVRENTSPPHSWPTSAALMTYMGRMLYCRSRKPLAVSPIGRKCSMRPRLSARHRAAHLGLAALLGLLFAATLIWFPGRVGSSGQFGAPLYGIVFLPPVLSLFLDARIRRSWRALSSALVGLALVVAGVVTVNILFIFLQLDERGFESSSGYGSSRRICSQHPAHHYRCCGVHCGRSGRLRGPLGGRRDGGGRPGLDWRRRPRASIGVSVVLRARPVQ